MNRSRGISGDIQAPAPQSSARRGQRPLPSGMPKRKHQLSSAPGSLQQKPRVQNPTTNTASPAKLTGRKKLLDMLQYPLIAGLALGASINTTFGQLIILVYAVIVIIFRRNTSALSFGLALLILISVPIFSAIGQSAISENAAIYVYELLVVGTIQAIVELKKSS
jgi:hypothetical protein